MRDHHENQKLCKKHKENKHEKTGIIDRIIRIGIILQLPYKCPAKQEHHHQHIRQKQQTDREVLLTDNKDDQKSHHDDGGIDDTVKFRFCIDRIESDH
jgi:hypothetical protein